MTPSALYLDGADITPAKVFLISKPALIVATTAFRIKKQNPHRGSKPCLLRPCLTFTPTLSSSAHSVTSYS